MESENNIYQHSSRIGFAAYHDFFLSARGSFHHRGHLLRVLPKWALRRRRLSI